MQHFSQPQQQRSPAAHQHHSAPARPLTPGANGAKPHTPAAAASAQSKQSFVVPPHARQLQTQKQQPANPKNLLSVGHKPVANGVGAAGGAGSGKSVFFPSHSAGSIGLHAAHAEHDDFSDDDRGAAPGIDGLMAGVAVLPRTIAFQKSSKPFSSAPNLLAHKPPPQPAQQPQQHVANGAPRAPLHQNGFGKPAAALNSTLRPPPHPTANAGQKLSPSPKQQQLHQQQPKQQQRSPALTATHHAGQPVVRCKDPNEFRWPKRYLFPSTSVVALLRQAPFDAVGCGLNNMGNTCFLNAVLQALAYCPPLAAYLRTKVHSRSCRVRGPAAPQQHQQQHNHHNHHQQQQQQQQPFCLFCALESTCNAMASRQKGSGGGGGGALAPNQIVRHLRAISRSFHLGRQEDSHEFLRFVMELLQKNDLASHGGPNVIKDIRVQETTALFGIFGGYFRSQVRCLECNYRSNTFDTFLDLSLELSHVSSLPQALHSFTRPEKLDQDNLYNCSQCKKKVRAEKRLTIFKAPTVLCVHLKRFQFAHQFGGKINKPIDFKDRLSLEQYMSDGSTKTTYSLYAVLVHSGSSIHSGHYYSFVKSGAGQWWCMDDSSVRQVSLGTVLEQRAYILFYVRTSIEALPIAAPSPGVSPAMAPVPPAAAASKLAQFALDAAAKKLQQQLPPAAQKQPVSSPMPTATPSSSSEGDSDEGEAEYAPVVTARTKSSSAHPSPSSSQEKSPQSSAASTAAAAQSDSDVSMDDGADDDYDDDENDDDDDAQSDSPSLQEALDRSSLVDRRMEMLRRRAAIARRYRLAGMTLSLHPSNGGAPRFSAPPARGRIFAFLTQRIIPRSSTLSTTRKRKRIVYDEEDDDAADQYDDDMDDGDAEEHESSAEDEAHSGSGTSDRDSGDDNSDADEDAGEGEADEDEDESMSSADDPPAPSSAPSSPAPTAAKSPSAASSLQSQQRRDAEEKPSSKRQKTDAVSSSPAATSSKPQPVFFGTAAATAASPPNAWSAALPSAASSSAAAASSSSAASSSPVTSVPSSSPSSAAAAPRPSTSSGPIILSREPFDPRKLTHALNSSQFGVAGVGEWDAPSNGTTSVAETSAKYAMKMAQDKAREKLKPKQKEKSAWDVELDRGHVRKTKTNKSTAITSDGYGAASSSAGSSSNAFQRAQDVRNESRANERAGISSNTPGKGRAGGAGDSNSDKKKRGPQRGFKQKGLTSHKERNEKRKKGTGRKGPRDFTA